MPLVRKYKPQKFSDVIGQDSAINELKQFLNDFYNKKGKTKRAIAFHGPAGIGKTTLAEVCSKELDAELFELNSSDLRNKKKLNEVLRPAMEQSSLIQKRKIILVDEAGGITGTDRGGVKELEKLIDGAKHPIIITANDIWKRKLSPIRKKSRLVELKPLNPNNVKAVLISILKKEGKFIDYQILTKIAIRTKGDLRAAINDLQTAISADKPEEIEFGERNRDIGIFNALKRVFKGKADKEVLKTFNSVDMNLDEIMLWMEKNIPKEYSGEELVRAIYSLSNADLFKGRIYKKQYWRFLVYQNAFLSYGISAAKNTNLEKTSFTRYEKPTRILKIWLNNQRFAKKKSICQKYSRYSHVGLKRAMGEFPILKQIINSNPLIAKELRLSEQELEYLKR